MDSEKLQRRVNFSYNKYKWTEEQQKVFNKFISERYANYKNIKNTLRSYVDLLNQLVLKIKKPFSEITYDGLIPLLAEWQKSYSEATLHGRKCKLKAFFRWGSGNKNDPRIENIRYGGYISLVTIHDLLNDDEIKKIKKSCKNQSSRFSNG